MELFLDRKVLGNLQNMAEVDVSCPGLLQCHSVTHTGCSSVSSQIPLGVRGFVLSFCSDLIGQVRQPILAQVSVHEPLQVCACGWAWCVCGWMSRRVLSEGILIYCLYASVLV